MTHAPLSALPDPDRDAQFYDGVPLRRLIAWVLDTVLIVLATLLLVVTTLGLAAFLFVFVSLAVAFVYRFVSLSSASATPGMRLVGIEIRNRNGDRLNRAEAFVHTLAFLVVWTFVLPQILSVAMMALTARGTGLHDLPIGSAAINRPL